VNFLRHHHCLVFIITVVLVVCNSFIESFFHSFW